MTRTLYPSEPELVAARSRSTGDTSDAPQEMTSQDQAVNLIVAGPTIGQAYADDWADNSIQQSTLDGIADRANEWVALAQADAENIDTVGTLGYFAQSALDFWIGVQNLFNAAAPPAVMVEQFEIWRDYTTAQQGKAFSDMDPIDIWFANR